MPFDRAIIRSHRSSTTFAIKWAFTFSTKPSMNGRATGPTITPRTRAANRNTATTSISISGMMRTFRSEQMGFYVFDEAFDEWTRDWPYNYTENPRGKSQYGYHLYFDQWHDADIRAMLRRDRNQPSVILWSIGNEIPNQMNLDGYKLACELVAICHEEDPTRPATSACDQSYYSSRNGFMDALDIGGYNYIDRLYSTNTYVPERARFPKRIFLGTETSHTVHYWLGVRDNDYVIGDFISTGVDYLGEAGAFPRRGSSSGVIDLAGGKKPGFYQRAAYWSDHPVLKILVLANQNTGGGGGGGRRGGPAFGTWSGTTNTQLTVRAVANCEEVELFLNDRSLGRQAVSRNLYYNDWSVPYAPGVLSAIGYNAGRQAVTNELRTAGAAARLQIKPVPVSISRDLAFCVSSVVFLLLWSFGGGEGRVWLGALAPPRRLRAD